MEDFKKKSGLDVSDKEIVFSQSIKAGKRIYYLDVKKNRKDEMFLAITESKKIVTGEGDESQVSFEKHKIFLYKEDFEKFMVHIRRQCNAVAVVKGYFLVIHLVAFREHLVPFLCQIQFFHIQISLPVALKYTVLSTASNHSLDVSSPGTSTAR